MNLTQNNPAGCAAVVDAGALLPVASLLAQMVRGGPKIKGASSTPALPRPCLARPAGAFHFPLCLALLGFGGLRAADALSCQRS